MKKIFFNDDNKKMNNGRNHQHFFIALHFNWWTATSPKIAAGGSSKYNVTPTSERFIKHFAQVVPGTVGGCNRSTNASQ